MLKIFSHGLFAIHISLLKHLFIVFGLFYNWIVYLFYTIEFWECLKKYILGP